MQLLAQLAQRLLVYQVVLLVDGVEIWLRLVEHLTLH
jgi:hypothetical protein